MAATKLAKVDLIVVLAIVLTVIVALWLGVKIARSIETSNKNATNGCDSMGYERKRTEEKYRCHDGYVNNGDSNNPKYPFFFFWFYNDMGSKAIPTTQEVIEQELECYVAALENSPWIVSKDQAEHNILISCVDSVSKKTKVNLCWQLKMTLLSDKRKRVRKLKCVFNWFTYLFNLFNYSINKNKFFFIILCL